MDFPSPRGVHVPDTHDPNFDPDDPYPPPSSRRNRYSRSVPRPRDATWISAPAPTPQTLRAPPSPWLAPPAPFSPGAHRPPSPIPPSPAPTVGEHMTVDDLAYELVDPYQRPQRPGLMKSFWKGLKKLSRLHHGPSFPIPRQSSYTSQAIEMPEPHLSDLSEATQYVDPTSSGTRTGSGTEGHTTERSTTPYTSPYARPANIGTSPAIIPGSLRASPVPVPSMDIPPAITVVSPSISPSPRPNSSRSVRIPSPGPPSRRTLSVGAPTPGPIGSTQEGSHTLHEPQPARPPPMSAPILVTRSDDDDDQVPLPPSGGGMGVQALVVDPSFSKGSFASTVARLKRFVADIDGLPWVSDSQIADEYIPEMNPRSRMRARVRQGAEPSWYNPRPEVVERHAYWSEWDMWAKQSAAALLDVSGAGRVGGWAGVGAGGGGQGPGSAQWGTVYPQGYVPTQSGFVYPSGYLPPGALSDHGHVPVLP